MTTYYDLVIRCPADIHWGHPTNRAQWYHANCGGKIQIGDNACYKCLSCGQKQHIKYGQYTCMNYEIDFKPMKADNNYVTAISILGQVTSIAGGRWLRTLMENLGDDW